MYTWGKYQSHYLTQFSIPTKKLHNIAIDITINDVLHRHLPERHASTEYRNFIPKFLNRQTLTKECKSQQRLWLNKYHKSRWKRPIHSWNSVFISTLIIRKYTWKKREAAQIGSDRGRDYMKRIWYTDGQVPQRSFSSRHYIHISSQVRILFSMREPGEISGNREATRKKEHIWRRTLSPAALFAMLISNDNAFLSLPRRRQL